MHNFPSHEEVLRLRAQYPPGTRVELTSPMQDPYAKLNAGERATVRGVDDAGHILWAKASVWALNRQWSKSAGICKARFPRASAA